MNAFGMSLAQPQTRPPNRWSLPHTPDSVEYAADNNRNGRCAGHQRQWRRLWRLRRLGSPYTITRSASTVGTFTARNYTTRYDTGLLSVSATVLMFTFWAAYANMAKARQLDDFSATAPVWNNVSTPGVTPQFGTGPLAVPKFLWGSYLVICRTSACRRIRVLAWRLFLTNTTASRTPLFSAKPSLCGIFSL